MSYDVVIVGGGPAGLSAALALGRARKRVLLCDSGQRRNEAAEEMHNFVTRDGTPPLEFRRLARAELIRYPSVEVRDVRVAGVSGARGAFQVAVASEIVATRRVLLATGMVDEMLPIDGFRELWGHAIVQCPYCHGWEVQDRRWGYLALGDPAHALPFVLKLRGWTRDVIVFTNGASNLARETFATLESAGIRLETERVVGLVARERRLEAVALADGRRAPCEVLFVHPPQRQVDVVRELGVALDDDGYVRVDPVKRETTVPGVFAAGDLISRQQAAIMAAAAGMQAAAAMNLDLSSELAASVSS
jgi:thioredoxin reductase